MDRIEYINSNKMKKKILIILHNLKNGGVERVLSVLANYFADNDYAVNVLAISSDEVSYVLSSKLNYEFVPIIPIYKHIGLIGNLKAIYKIHMEIKRINPDYVIGFDDSIIIRSIPSAWLQRKKIIVSERLDPSIYGLPMRIVRQVAYDMADHVVFQTEDAKAYFPKRTQKKSVVISNPLSEGLPLRNKNINKDIVMACRLRPQKNVGLAIQAFSVFYKNHPNYRLVIYGEGYLLDELKNLASKEGVSDAVFFPGHVSDIHSRMASCAMFLSTSDYEGLSNSMIEAMAIGTPTICTDCPVGGARMVIENNENGILVPVGDKDAIAEALSRVADDADFSKKLSANGVNIRKRLSVKEICPQWVHLLD